MQGPRAKKSGLWLIKTNGICLLSICSLNYLWASGRWTVLARVGKINKVPSPPNVSEADFTRVQAFLRSHSRGIFECAGSLSTMYAFRTPATTQRSQNWPHHSRRLPPASPECPTCHWCFLWMLIHFHIFLDIFPAKERFSTSWATRIFKTSPCSHSSSFSIFSSTKFALDAFSHTVSPTFNASGVFEALQVWHAIFDGFFQLMVHVVENFWVGFGLKRRHRLK